MFSLSFKMSSWLCHRRLFMVFRSSVAVTHSTVHTPQLQWVLRLPVLSWASRAKSAKHVFPQEKILEKFHRARGDGNNESVSVVTPDFLGVFYSPLLLSLKTLKTCKVYNYSASHLVHVCPFHYCLEEKANLPLEHTSTNWCKFQYNKI